MLQILLIKRLNYQQFIKNSNQLNFKYLGTKIRLVLPSLTNFNRQVLLNDGLPLEFILSGYHSQNIIKNSDIKITDYSSELFSNDQLYSSINKFVNKNKNENIIIVSLSDASNGVNLNDIEVPVLFIGNYFINKKLNLDFIYTINDVAITINGFYGIKTANARGKDMFPKELL